MTLATSKSFNQPVLPAVFPHWCCHLVIPHVGLAANSIWLLQHHNTEPSCAQILQAPANHQNVASDLQPARAVTAVTHGASRCSASEVRQKKKKSNPVFWCKSQVSFVSSDYNGNGRGVKVWWATVEIAVTTRGSGEGYIILKCPKRDEARELESLQWHAGFAVVLFPHSLSPCAHAAPRVTPWLHSLLHPRRKKKKKQAKSEFLCNKMQQWNKKRQGLMKENVQKLN